MRTDLNKVGELAGGESRAHFRATYSDIDPNGHVTAMKYLQWITDSHPRRVLEEKRPSFLELSFLAEAVLEDEVTVYSELLGGQEKCSVKRDGDQKELCRASIEWT
jgi:acyl-ACP thioesterase